MNNRERALAILNYQSYDQMPVVHFGFWNETMQKWADEGHITAEEASQWGDGNPADLSITRKLGFDFNWYSCFHWDSMLKPGFEPHLVRQHPDGSREGDQRSRGQNGAGRQRRSKEPLAGVRDVGCGLPGWKLGRHGRALGALKIRVE